MPKKIVEMTVESAKMELPDTKTIRLAWPEGYDVPFKTGQFITLYWPDQPKYKRAYSLSSCVLDRGHFEVTIKREGKMGTRIVDWAKEGDTLFVIPPTGRFLPVLEPDRHLVCIAGGSGVTPYRGFVREATRTRARTRITILYSVRTTSDIIFEEEFRQLEKSNPSFRFLVTCTRLSEDDPWPGRRGRIDSDWIREQIDDPDRTVLYACGPTALVNATEELARELELPRDRLRLEKWG